MTGRTTERPRVAPADRAESPDIDYAARIDAYLERAQVAEEPAEKNFHVRHARQLLEICIEE